MRRVSNARWGWHPTDSGRMVVRRRPARGRWTPRGRAARYSALRRARRLGVERGRPRGAAALQQLPRAGDDVLDGEAELLEHQLAGRRSAEALERHRGIDP